MRRGICEGLAGSLGLLCKVGGCLTFWIFCHMSDFGANLKEGELVMTEDWSLELICQSRC